MRRAKSTAVAASRVAGSVWFHATFALRRVWPAPGAGTWLAILVASLCATPPLHASTEEFSTFDVAGQEEDDESLLDHYMTRSPREWRAEWDRSPLAFRTSQGCLTSGRWFIDTDLKLHSDLGRRARFGLDLKQSESDAASYDYLDFSFHFPTRWGTPGAMFRPLYDKSRQDFAGTWTVGADTSTYQAEVVFTFEDAFNNLWAFRQTRVGQESEPYSRHPYEPGLSFAVRHPSWRADVSGRYLTPSVQHRLPGATQAWPRVRSLWGTLARASVEVQALGMAWEASGANQQAKSTDRVLDGASDANRNFRREWSVETSLRRRVSRGVTAEAHWLYQERGQHLGPPLGPGLFRGIDRLLTLESRIEITATLTARVGGLYDRITIARAGNLPSSYGTRIESRAYVGLAARFGRVSLLGIEGLELDPEAYDVWGIHDKGFLHLQTTF